MTGKRSADEYITKDHGSTPSEGASDDKPRIATAAQMSARKTATPRGRLNRSGTPQRRFAPSANTTPNPFNAMPQQTFGAVGNGVVFGGQQTNNATQSQQGGFNFSANNNSGNNPFANVSFGNVNGTNSTTIDQNGDEQQGREKRRNSALQDLGGSSQPQFSGFKPLPTTNTQSGFTFGAPQSQNQPAQSTPSQPAANPFGGLFGGASNNSSAAQSPAPSFNFGQNNAAPSPAPAFGGFGTSNSTQQHSTNIFGQNNNNSATNNTQQNSSVPSGQSNNTANQNESAQQSALPSFNFGATTPSATQSQSSSAPSNLLFGATNATTSTPQQRPSLFRVTSNGPEDEASSVAFDIPPAWGKPEEPAKSPSPFGPSPSDTAASMPPPAAPYSSFASSQVSSGQKSPPKNAFNFGQPPQGTSGQKSPPKATFSFGQPTQVSSAQASPAKTRFGFGQSSQVSAEKTSTTPTPAFSFGATANGATAQPAQSAIFGASQVSLNTESASKSSSGFSFGQSASTPQLANSVQKEPVAQPSTQEAQKTSLFGQAASPKDTQQPSLFGQAPSSKEAQQPSLFGQAASTNTAQKSLLFGQAASSKEAQQPSLFGQAASTTTSTTPSASNKSASNWDQSAQSASATSSELFKSAASPFGSLNTVSAPPSSTPSISSSKTASQPAQQTKQVATENVREESTTVTAPKKNLFGTLSRPNDAPTQRQVYTKSPSRIPSFLNGEGYKEYDNNYRLRALNKEFKKQIAAWDPDRSDIDDFIRHYVTARAAVGGDVGLYQRALAGSKRKNDESQEEDEVPAQYKKVKFAGLESSKSRTNAQIDAQAPRTNTSVPAPVAPKPLSPGKATSLFNNMIPTSSEKVTETPDASATKSNNAFSFGSTSNAGHTPKKLASNVFGSLSGSTTPQASPPKKSLFGTLGADTPAFDVGSTKKRKSTSDGEDEDTSEDEVPQKRSKISAQKATKVFGTSSASKKTTHGPFEEDSSEEDEDEADIQTRDDAQDSDFASNAGGSDNDESEDEQNDDDSDDAIGTAQQEESETSRASDEDHSQEVDNNPNKGKSLFDRIEKPAAKTDESTKATQSQAPSTGFNWKPSSHSTPDAPAFSPITPATNSPYKPATTFNFTPTPAVKPFPEPGASVLQGGTTNGPFSKFEGMFGSRPSTPEPEKVSKTTEAPTSTPTGDHTWKRNSPIKFSASVIPPSPQPDKDATSTPGLFGMSTPGQATGTESNSLGFSFGKHLGPNSGISSGISSRATSPGLTDNESVATNDTTEDVQNEPQQNLMEARPGEENEKVLFECKAKALLMVSGERATELKVRPNYWESIGQGNFRVLQNKDTNKVRVLLRAEPNANIALNSYLHPEIEYLVREQVSNKTGALNARFDYKGGLDHIVLKVRSPEIAQQIADLLNKHK